MYVTDLEQCLKHSKLYYINYWMGFGIKYIRVWIFVHLIISHMISYTIFLTARLGKSIS